MSGMFGLSIEGQQLFSLEFGDIVPYLSLYTCSLFLLATLFIIIALITKPENQAVIIFGTDGFYEKENNIEDLRFQRFMAVACGLATLGTVVSGDLFNYTLFTALVGITNIGIIAATDNRHILSAGFHFGIVAMIATTFLFGGAAIALGATGTLSIWELAGKNLVPLAAKIFLVFGVFGEGMAPFYVGKSEMTRAPGAPYILMITVSSLLIFLRVIEIVLTV
jgi:energy-converting hydrogenase A subunit H